MADAQDDHTRKPGGGLWMSSKQIYSAGAITIALGAIPTLNVITEYITKANSSAIARIEANQLAGFERIEKAMLKHIDDEIVTHRRIKDKNDEAFAASEVRCEQKASDLKERVVNLEIYAYKLRSPKGGS